MKRWILPLAAAVTLTLGIGTPARADDQEQQIGAQVYDSLAKKGELILSSPLYNTLNPLAKRISAVANPQYDYPFRFFLVHEKSPNAFAVPGGNVYVTDSLMQFVKTREELAGVLCHETSHDIHHDVLANMRRDQNLAIGASVLSLLINGGHNTMANNALGFLESYQSLKYSRAVERNADLKGAYTCAQAGCNPYGIIRLFQQYESADTGGRMEMLSDHPTDAHRIADLRHEFATHPETFGRFSASAQTPLDAPSAQQSR